MSAGKYFINQVKVDMLINVLRVIAWIVGIFWFTFFMIAIVYKDDPIVRASVRTMAASIASIFAETKELKNQIKSDIKKELKENK